MWCHSGCASPHCTLWWMLWCRIDGQEQHKMQEMNNVWWVPFIHAGVGIINSRNHNSPYLEVQLQNWPRASWIDMLYMWLAAGISHMFKFMASFDHFKGNRMLPSPSGEWSSGCLQEIFNKVHRASGITSWPLVLFNDCFLLNFSP